MTMPDGNSAAESRHAHEQAEGEKLRETYAEQALDDLVWRVMSGKGYPKTGSPATCLDAILSEEADAARVSKVIREAIFGLRFDAYYILQTGIESIVRDYLRDSKFHEMRIAELIEEAEDEA